MVVLLDTTTLESRVTAEELILDGVKIMIPKENLVYMSPDKRALIINDDFLNIEYLPPDSVDLIVTSPPYNVDIEYEGYKDNIPYDKYLEFTEAWLSKAFKLLKPDGRMCLNIPLDKSKGRGEEGFQSVYADIVQIAI
jgi:site-specific DNA-methyltransferase (adenine-specific)